MSELDDFLRNAQRTMFPQMKRAAFAILPMVDPDPKLCLEIGTAVMFNKPILVICPKGKRVPLALRTIATKIVEEFDPDDEMAKLRARTAIREILESLRFRG